MILHIWRHPKPNSAQGICIGQTDVTVDKRKLKRLANRIERFVRRHQLPKVIWVSSLQRSLNVGKILEQRGFECRVTTELKEINFGKWESHPWDQIDKQEIDEWCDNFARFAPDKGENLQQLFSRTEKWLDERADKETNNPILAVGHAGWINAAKRIEAGQDVPQIAADWPRSVKYMEHSILHFNQKNQQLNVTGF